MSVIHWVKANNLVQPLMLDKASCELQLAVQQNFKHFHFFAGGGGELDATHVLLMPSIVLY